MQEKAQLGSSGREHWDSSEIWKPLEDSQPLSKELCQPLIGYEPKKKKKKLGACFWEIMLVMAQERPEGKRIETPVRSSGEVEGEGGSPREVTVRVQRRVEGQGMEGA